MVDAWVQIAVFSCVIVAGLMWGRRAWRRWSEYSFAEDFRATFLRVRWAYSGDLGPGAATDRMSGAPGGPLARARG